MFVLYEFADPLFEALYKKESRILGYPALLDIACKKYTMPDLDRPLFSLSMENVVSCFTGFRNREEVVRQFFYLLLCISENLFIYRMVWCHAFIIWEEASEKNLTATKFLT